MNKKVLHDALILTAFTLVLGFILGFVYELTKEPIAKAEADTKKAAYQAVFEDADHFTEVSIDKEQANTMVSENGFSDTIDDVCEANDSSGNPLGYVITVTAKDASQGSITFSVGIRLDGTVNGYSITSIAIIFTFHFFFFFFYLTVYSTVSFITFTLSCYSIALSIR